MASIKPVYVFSLLSALGLLAQWGAMIANGTLLCLMVTSWEGYFPGGHPMNTTWSGLWPIDFTLGLLVAFFYPLLNVKDLNNLAPFLVLTDLLFSLSVFAFFAAVQGRRSRNGGLLGYPALWQLTWQFCGAATIMPLYLHSYIKTRESNSPSPIDQTRILSFAAVWAVLSNFPLLLPGIVGASPFAIQLSIVIWFFLPLIADFVQNRIGTVSVCRHPGEDNTPIIIGYGIVGSASALVHLTAAFWAYNSEEISWTRIYWPAYSAVQPGPNLLLQGATLFCQYGYTSLCGSTLALALHTFGRDITVGQTSLEPARAGRSVLFTVLIILGFGPGAGAAYLLCRRETETNKRIERSKDL